MRSFAGIVFVIVGFFLLSGCSTVDLLNATIPTTGFHIIKDVPYGDGDRHTLDIYVPDHLAEGHPVVVFYYGGSWKMGSKNDYLFAGQALASKGIIAVIPDYRLYPEVYFPDFMNDVAESFVWTHQHIKSYGGDPASVFVAGHSAGAYNALMLTLNTAYLHAAQGQDAWIRGTIGLSGPYDFLPLTDPVLIDLFSTRPIETTQPINFARPHTPPILLLTGDDDDDVSPENSQRLAKKLTGMGDNVTIKTYPGLGHIGIALSLADGFRGRAPTLDDMASFVSAQTKKKTPP